MMECMSDEFGVSLLADTEEGIMDTRFLNLTAGNIYRREQNRWQFDDEQLLKFFK